MQGSIRRSEWSKTLRLNLKHLGNHCGTWGILIRARLRPYLAGESDNITARADTIVSMGDRTHLGTQSRPNLWTLKHSHANEVVAQTQTEANSGSIHRGADGWFIGATGRDIAHIGPVL